MNSKANKLLFVAVLFVFGLVLACASCASRDFQLRDYDLEFQACAAGFSASTPTPVDAEVLARKRRNCRIGTVRGFKECSSRHVRGRGLDFCKRAVKSNRRACYYQASFLNFSGPGPETYRRDTCAAARSGITEICFHYGENYGSVAPAGSPETSAAQLPSEQIVAPMTTPTPLPASCTSTCVTDCVDQYYEDYDYNAEQLCYYNKCGC